MGPKITSGNGTTLPSNRTNKTVTINGESYSFASDVQIDTRAVASTIKQILSTDPTIRPDEIKDYLRVLDQKRLQGFYKLQSGIGYTDTTSSGQTYAMQALLNQYFLNKLPFPDYKAKVEDKDMFFRGLEAREKARERHDLEFYKLIESLDRLIATGDSPRRQKTAQGPYDNPYEINRAKQYNRQDTAEKTKEAARMATVDSDYRKRTKLPEGYKFTVQNQRTYMRVEGSLDEKSTSPFTIQDFQGLPKEIADLIFNNNFDLEKIRTEVENNPQIFKIVEEHKIFDKLVRRSEGEPAKGTSTGQSSAKKKPPASTKSDGKIPNVATDKPTESESNSAATKTKKKKKSKMN